MGSEWEERDEGSLRASRGGTVGSSAQGNREPCRGRIPTAQGFLPVSAESRERMKGGVGGRK